MAAPMMSQILSRLTRQVSCWSHPRENPYRRPLFMSLILICTYYINPLSSINSWYFWNFLQLIALMLWAAATYKSEALRVINILMRATLASWKTTRSPDTNYKRNCIIRKLLSHLVTDRVPKISWKMHLWHVEQGFSSFFAKCLPYLMIFQSGVH